MAKSLRSKFKKKQRALKSVKEQPKLLARVDKLHHKLELCATGGIGSVPMQEPPANFGFSNPKVPRGQRLRLDPVTTSVYGLSDAERSHAQSRKASHVAANTPLAGLAVTREMLEKGRNAEDDLFVVNGKVVGSSVGKPLSAKDFMKLAQPIDDDGDAELVGDIGEGEFVADVEGDGDDAAAPQRIKSMQQRKGETKGGTKMKSATDPRQRLVAGTAKRGKGVKAKRT